MEQILTFIKRAAFWLFFLGFILGVYLTFKSITYDFYLADRNIIMSKGVNYFMSKEFFEKHKKQWFFNESDYKQYNKK